MKHIKIPVGHEPFIIKIPADLDSYYKELNCDLVEFYTLKYGEQYEVIAILDEEGRIKDPVLYNRVIDPQKPINDFNTFCGDFLITGIDNESGEFVELNDKDLKYWSNYFNLMNTGIVVGNIPLEIFII